MDHVPSIVGFGTGVRTSHDLDGIEFEDQPAEAETLSGSPKPSYSSLGNSQPSDGPRAHVLRLGREYGLMAPTRLTASVSNAVDMYVNSLAIAELHPLLTVS